MSHRLVHTMREIARDSAGQQWGSAIGVVRSVFGRGGAATEHSCTVELRESGLVLPHVPIAVGVMGAAALPREGDLVVLVFAGGDLHAPVVVGRLYSERVEPPEHDEGEVVVSLPGGEDSADARLLLRVSTPGDGTRSATVELDGSVKVTVTIDDNRVEVVAGEATLTLSQSSSSDGKAELKVGGSSVVIEQGGDVTVVASGTLKLQGSSVEISGDSTIKVAGQTIDLN